MVRGALVGELGRVEGLVSADEFVRPRPILRRLRAGEFPLVNRAHSDPGRVHHNLPHSALFLLALPPLEPLDCHVLFEPVLVQAVPPFFMLDDL